MIFGDLLGVERLEVKCRLNILVGWFWEYFLIFFGLGFFIYEIENMVFILKFVVYMSWDLRSVYNRI